MRSFRAAFRGNIFGQYRALWGMAICVAILVGFVSPANADSAPGQTAHGGIGIQISSTQDGRTLIVRVIEGGAAAEAGITTGDAIIAVNGQSTSGVGASDIAHQIAGTIGTNVAISVLHTDGTQQDYTLTRRALVAAPTPPGDSEPPQGAGQPANPLDQISPAQGPEQGAPATVDGGRKVAAGAGDVRIFRRKMIHDDYAQMDAMSVLVPDGWTVQSSIFWRYDVTDPAHAIIRISNPNGVEALTSYGGGWWFTDYSRMRSVYRTWPSIPNWGRGGDGGSLVCTMFATPADFARSFLGVFRAKNLGSPELETARVVDARDALPALAEMIRAKQQAGEDEALRMNGYSTPDRVRVSVQRVRFEYALQGKGVYEDAYTFIVRNPIIPSVYAGYPTISWQGTVITYRGEQANIDQTTGLLDVIRASIRPNLEWFAQQQRVIEDSKVMFKAQHDIEMNALRQAQLRQEIQQHTNDAISQQERETFDNQIKAQNEVAEGWCENARGVEERTNPIDQTPVEVPIGTEHSWVSNTGTLLESDKPGYDVHSDPRFSDQDWTETQPATH